MIRYWNKLINMSTSRLTHKICEWDYKLLGGNANWSSEIRAIMNDNGFEDKFISKLQCNLEIIKCRIKDKEGGIAQLVSRLPLNVGTLIQILVGA